MDNHIMAYMCDLGPVNDVAKMGESYCSLGNRNTTLQPRRCALSGDGAQALLRLPRLKIACCTSCGGRQLLLRWLKLT